MTSGTETEFELQAYTDWIRQTDDHAEHHLNVLTRVQQSLDRGEAAPEAMSLAAKLERWRYQYLNEHADGMTARGEHFLDALERAARRLRGAVPQSPRRTRQAIADSAGDPPTFREAVAGLDPRYPLEELVQRARQLTTGHRCGEGGELPEPAPRRMLLYAPLYVSSECVNWCTYCGFRHPLEIPRKHLSVDEAVSQARFLRSQGFRHILVVGGDFPRKTTTGYYAEIAGRLSAEGIEPAIEIAAQSTDGYAELAAAGVCGVTLYQETYDLARYREVHVRGPKASYAWRLEAHDRAAEAGVKRLGLGILLGLADPQADVLALMRHGAYLAKRFPDCTLAFSLPRIHEAPDGFQLPCPVADEDLLRMYCALRVAFPAAVLVLSTRESAPLRDRLARICITQMSAGSSTTPGGYGQDAESGGQQFPVVDHRSAAEVAEGLVAEGYRVCWSTCEE